MPERSFCSVPDNIKGQISEDRFARQGKAAKNSTGCTASRPPNAAWRNETYQEAFFTPGICPL